MANTDNPNGFRVVKTLSGGPPTIMYFPVASSETLAKGDAVLLSSGQVTIGLSNSGTLLGVMAKASVTATENTMVPVYVGCENNIFEGQVSGTFARSNVGVSYDIAGATGIMEVNLSGTTEKVVRIVDWNPNDSVGEFTRVRFVIARSEFNDYQDAET